MKKILFILASVFVININAQNIITIAGNGTFGYSGDGGQATIAELGKPGGITFDATGNLYFADSENDCIRKINNSGIITTIVGNGTNGFTGDGGQATNAQLSNPYGVVIDASGNLYIADGYNNRIRKVNTLGIITTIAGNGTTGYSGDGGQATAAELYIPSGITIDILGNLYIATNSSVRKVNTLGIITTFAGNGTGGYSGDGGQATAAQLYPSRVTIDITGNLYISDGNNRIRKVNTSGIITTIAGNGIGGYTGDGGQATNAELNQPFGIATDSYGNLYFSDDGNSRIRMINTSGVISTVAGNGVYGFSGDGAAATLAELANPYCIATDVSGNLYIADQDNERIRKISNVAATGIEQFTNHEQINIYPNPNNGSFVIEPQNTLYNVHCTVYDVNGKAVLTQTINGKTSIDAGSLNEGVYNICLTSNEGVVNKRLVIVR